MIISLLRTKLIRLLGLLVLGGLLSLPDVARADGPGNACNKQIWRYHQAYRLMTEFCREYGEDSEECATIGRMVEEEVREVNRICGNKLQWDGFSLLLRWYQLQYFGRTLID